MSLSLGTSYDLSVTPAQLIIEVRRRASIIPHAANDDRQTVEEAIAVLGAMALVGESAEAKAVREILAAIIGIEPERGFEGEIVNSLSSDTVLQLDLLFHATLEGGWTQETLRAALRPVLVQRVK